MASSGTALPPPPLPPPPGVGVPLSKTILLYNLPDFLSCDKNRVRSWLGEVAAVRHIHLIGRTRKKKDHASATDTSGSAKEEPDKTSSEDSRPAAGLVTLSHADGAVKVLGALRQAKLDPAVQAQWVPAAPHVPLPPPSLDSNLAESLGLRLTAAYQRLQAGQALLPRAAGDSSGTTTTAATEVVTTDHDNDLGAADDDEDPLTSAAVLQAVRQFRASLEAQQGSKAVRRKELVQASLDRILPRVRQDMANSHQGPPTGGLPPPPMGGPLPPPLPSGLPAPLPPPPPPPPVGMPPPMPTGMVVPPPPPMPPGQLPVPPPPAINLPLPPPPLPVTEEPPAKRIKPSPPPLLDLTQGFPVIPTTHAPALRAHAHVRLAHYLGATDDDALLDFVWQKINDPALPVQSYVTELQDVLEEDAQPFLQELYAFVQSRVV